MREREKARIMRRWKRIMKVQIKENRDSEQKK
jgi:hypothetical protein